MIILDKISFALILCFVGHIISLPSSFGAPSGCKDDYTKEELNNYCKYGNGQEPDICREYCQKARTIDTSILPSPLDQLNKTLVGQLRAGCDGFCYQNSTCLCGFASGQLNKELSKTKVGQIAPTDTVFLSSVVIGGKNITVSQLLCEDPE
ncbi:unnamed protein product [Adineta steineri]|uniref:Uncharacterized protein n=1 Tax=Adineta steineri TaxID=433720 RepID=A0A814A129_9BILA|nr:unnamed protein product [Adineta steineri]CAF0908035.1 unnamed protein product [Adineta steineri]CAF3894717.1 unnamed protein product [Adineta steineri]CAF4109617.1 unnamed protein product [Adineta steineri]